MKIKDKLTWRPMIKESFRGFLPLTPGFAQAAIMSGVLDLEPPISNEDPMVTIEVTHPESRATIYGDVRVRDRAQQQRVYHLLRSQAGMTVEHIENLPFPEPVADASSPE